MKKKKNVVFDDFDDFFEQENDESFSSATVEMDYSNVQYEDFNKATQSYEEEYKEVSKKKSNSSFVRNSEFISFLSFFWTWFRRMGIAIAIILIAYYITKGMFMDLFTYLLLLVGAFFFGFGFMFLVNKYKESR